MRTMQESVAVAWMVQVHAAGDLAFVFDATGDVMLAILESVTGRPLPPVPNGIPRPGAADSESWLQVGDHLVAETLHGAEQLAMWLNWARDTEARLTWWKPCEQLRDWWMDGVHKLRAEHVSAWLEV